LPLTSKVFKSIDTIPQPYWDSVNCCTNIYYSPEFLKAFELANTDIEFNYIFILKDQEAVAFANTQIVTIGVETITKNIKMSDKIRHWVNNMFCSNHICVLFCGNVFLSGEYGTFLKDGEDKVDTFKAIAEGVKQLSKSTKKLNAIWSVVFVVVGATFGTYLFNPLALNKLKASTVGIFIYLQPVVAGLFAISIGADFIDSVKIGAMLLIFLGVFLVSKKPKNAI